MAVKKMSFEEKLARLEEIVALLEKGDAALAASLSLFEEGTKLANACTAELDKAGLTVRLWSCRLRARRTDV